MSKLCLKRRELKRTFFRNKYWSKRRALRVIINSLETSSEEKELAQLAMSKLPRDSSASRRTRRCKLTGRARGVYRIFGMCRNMIRIYAGRGDIPGLHKASW